MPTGSLKISHNFAGETQFIIAVWRKAVAPLVEVGRQAYAFPHSQQSLLIINLDPEWYFIKFYRSVDGIALGQEILTLAGNAAASAIYPITRYEYVVNRGEGEVDVWSDPIAGDTGLRDTRLKGKMYWVEERGTASLLQISPSEEITDFVDGGFDFVNPDKSFEDGGVYVVTVIERVEVTGGGGGGSNSGNYDDVVIMEANMDFDPVTMGGKLIVARVPFAGNGIAVLTLPNLDLIPDTKFKVQTHSGDAFQKYLSIQLDAGDEIDFMFALFNVLHLGKGEMIEILIRENEIYILGYDGEYRRLGLRIWGDKQMLNTLLLDGTQYNQADQPRLMQFVETLPGAQVLAEGVAVGQWGYMQVVDGKNVFPNKGLFARDDIAGKIRVPDMRNMFIRSLKNLDGSADAERVQPKIGGYQIDKFKAHTHTAKENWHLFGTSGHGNLSSNDDAVRQEAWNRTQDGLNNTGGTETRGENIGLIPLLIV